MPVENLLIEAAKIIAQVPPLFIAGMIVLLSFPEWKRWVSHRPIEAWERETGLDRDFAVVKSELAGSVVGIIAGMSTYFFFAFCLVVAVVISTLLLGTTPSYEFLVYTIAALSLLVGIAAQNYYSFRAREFFAWGK